MANIDERTVKGFGEEWTAFDQTGLPDEEARLHFDAYFAPFRWDLIDNFSIGFDMGCGTGRWAKLLAPRVGHLHCIDPSGALDVARANLADVQNVTFHRASVDQSPLAPASMDFGVSLGVLHHVPDTAAAINSCVALLKPGAPLLLYLYYRFDNRPIWYQLLWRISDAGRQVISRLSRGPRLAVTSIIAMFVYWPIARFAKLLTLLGIDAKNMPLYSYRDASFYTMRTDSLDRFGTSLEQRFTRVEIAEMLTDAGCRDIRFSDKLPFWCACAVRGPI